jgi:hypothetical protein
MKHTAYIHSCRRRYLVYVTAAVAGPGNEFNHRSVFRRSVILSKMKNFLRQLEETLEIKRMESYFDYCLHL